MSYLTFAEGAAPSTPASGKGSHYLDANGEPRVLNDRGEDLRLTGRELASSIRNGGFWFAQRQTPGTLTTYSSTTGRAFAPDGWAITNENASAQYQRTDATSTAEAGLSASHYGNFTKITTTGKLEVSQCIEGADVSPLRGKTIRIQFVAKQIVAVSPVLRVGLLRLSATGTIDTLPASFITAHGANGVDPTFGTNLALVAPKASVTPENGTISGNGVDFPLDAPWKQFGACWDVPIDCKNLIVVFWGSNQFAATNGFALSEVKLTVGHERQAWSPSPVQVERDLCQRYYSKTFGLDMAPVQNAGVNTGELRWVKVVAGATPTRSPRWYFPTRMRTAPTIITYNPAAANAEVRDTTGNVNCTATAILGTSDSGTSVSATGNAATLPEAGMALHFTADAEL